MSKKPKIVNYAKEGKNGKIPIYELPEPYPEEIDRIRYTELSKAGLEFANKLENFGKEYRSTHYESFEKYEGQFYSRYFQRKSSSLGLIITDIDKTRLAFDDTGHPELYQMGKLRRRLAIAQRALYFDKNQNENIYKIIVDINSGKIKIPTRSNRKMRTVEYSLGITDTYPYPTKTPAISELGYKKISSDKILSRKSILEYGLFNKIGKHTRKIIGLGSMPPVTGWRDTLVTAAIGHMMCFIPRNSIFAADINRRQDLVKSVLEVIDSLNINNQNKKIIKRNIGASVGLDNLQEEIRAAKKLYKAGITLFRIYTIGSDKRVIDTASALRYELGNEAEIFVGQIADKKQAEKLIKPKIAVDALIFGHGGGQQCTSAINGMAITTLEDVYELVRDKNFNNTSLIVEGGIDRSIGTALILGIDATLGNQKLVHGTIETGDIFAKHIKGKYCQPYPGSASPVTQLIESEFELLRVRRSDASGRTYNPEGKPGFMYFEKKANSCVFWINEFLSYAARALADLGVNNITELRQLLGQGKSDYLRVMSEKTQFLSDAHGDL